jgi:hypothetical protein
MFVIYSLLAGRGVWAFAWLRPGSIPMRVGMELKQKMPGKMARRDTHNNLTLFKVAKQNQL